MRCSPLLLILFTCVWSHLAKAEEMPNLDDRNLSQAVYFEGKVVIPGLTWTGENGISDFSVERQNDGLPNARVTGRFESKNAGTLLFTSKSIQRAQYLDELGNFTVLIPLSARKTPVKVQYIDDYGNQKSQSLFIIYEGYHQSQLVQVTKKRWNFDGGASLSYLDYKQAAGPVEVKIAQIGITPKLGVTYNATQRIDIGGSIFGTLIGFPYSSVPKEDGGVSTPRFYGINMRVGIKIRELRTGNIYMMTGPYFWGMVVPPSPNGYTYGVVKLSGPQLFLVGRFLSESGKMTVAYLKGASILDGDRGMKRNYELAVGGAYQISAPKVRPRVMVNLDIATAKFLVQNEAIQLNSLSLGVSTSF